MVNCCTRYHKVTLPPGEVHGVLSEGLRSHWTCLPASYSTAGRRWRFCLPGSGGVLGNWKYWVMTRDSRGTEPFFFITSIQVLSHAPPSS